MRAKFTLFLIVVLGSVFAATSAFSQVTYDWSGTLSGGDGANIATIANWTTNEVGPPYPPAASAPSGNTQDTGQWDNLVPGNLVVTYSPAGGLPSTGGGTIGIIFQLSANQTGNVSLVGVGGATGNIGLFGINNFSPTATFTFGVNNDNVNILNMVPRPSAATHDMVNNSAGGVIINNNVRWQAGGGNVHTMIFDGTGNWYVTNSLAEANNTGVLIEKAGGGTMYWNGPSLSGAAPNSTINSPIQILGGTLDLLWNNTLINTVTFTDNSLLEYNAPGQSQILSGVVTGAGNLQVAGGTLILNGANSYGGSTTLSGGEASLDIAETVGTSGPLGEGGTITFSGGVMGFTSLNTFDYSSRFSTAASQQYSFDTAGQSVTLAIGLTSSGGTLTKLNAGVLNLTGVNTYNGLTAVGAGTLNIQGSAGTGNIIVSNNATLGVFEGGSQLTPGTLTVGTTSGANLTFNNVSSTTTAPLAAGSISVGAPITVNVASGTFTVGQSYPLIKWTGGSAPGVTLGNVVGAAGNLTTNGSTIQLNITSISYVWTGKNNGNWDTTTANNWKFNGVAATYVNANPALFDDTATGTTNVTLDAPITPSGVTLNNNNLQYSIASSGANLIGGTGGLTINGNNLATLSGGVNAYTGVTTLNAGILSVGSLANGGSPSDIGAAANSAANLVLNGGTLQYTGTGATSGHLFTVGLSGGTLDDEGGTLNLTNAGVTGFNGSGARTVILTGSDPSGDIIATLIGDNGGSTALTKNGAGTWIVTALNTYSGVNTINNGILQVGNGGSSSIGTGSVIDNSSLVFDNTNTVTVGTVTGSGQLSVNGTGTVILPGNNSYSGGTTISAGTLQIGNGGATGQLNLNVGITNNSLLVFNSTGTLALGGAAQIIGTGNLVVEGNGGLLQALGANTYTGWTYIAPGANFQPCQGNQGGLTSSVVTNNGTLTLVRQDTGVFITSTPIVGTGTVHKDLNNQNPGDVTLTGNSTYTGGTTINGGAIILGDNATIGTGSIVGNVVMTSNALDQAASTMEFNRPDTYTFTGVISGNGSLLDNGNGILILTGNNTYTIGTTTINNTNDPSTLQVGNGGTSGSIGTEPVIDNGTLSFDRSDSIIIANNISGTGAVEQIGTGILTMTSVNTYTGATIVANGTLILSGQSSPGGVSVNGDLDAYGGGTLNSGGTGVVVSNTVAGSMNISNSTVVVTINKSQAQPNTLYTVAGTPTVITASTLSVANAGSAIQAGDVYTVFSKGVANGNLLTVTGGGVTWQNNLASNGTIKALTSGASVPKFGQISVSGHTLTISATGGTANGTYVLLGRTNLVSGAWKPIFTNSYDANGNIVNLSTNIVNPSVPIQFYLLSQ